MTGPELRAWRRERARLSQIQLAKALDCSLRQVQSWEAQPGPLLARNVLGIDGLSVRLAAAAEDPQILTDAALRLVIELADHRAANQP